MRRSKEPAKWKQLIVIVLVALVLPLGVSALKVSGGSLSAIGERLGSVGVVLNMPDAGLRVLLERFQDTLYPPAQEESQLPAVHMPGRMETSQPARPEGEASSSAAQEEASRTQPRIPLKYQGMLLAENFSGQEDAAHIRVGAGLIRNTTKHENDEVLALLETPHALTFEEEGPLVLIYHTHATESFERYSSGYYDTRNTWRSTDNNNNMVAVGAVMAAELEAQGIAVIHDTTQHDYPSYNGSYERSAETVAAYLEEYPSIRVVLDLHRDAMERDDQVIVKPVAEVAGDTAAQIMIIAGCDDGTMNMPGWRENLRFAAAYQDQMEGMFPGLTRPVLFSYRKYNQDLSPGSLLLEFGSNANTLEEATHAAKLAAEALAALIEATLA